MQFYLKFMEVEASNMFTWSNQSLCDHLLHSCTWFLAKHILFLMVLQVIAWSLHIQEHRVGPADVRHVHLGWLSLGSQQGTSCNQLDGITQGSIHADFGQEDKGFFSHLDVLLLASGFDDLPHFVFGIILGLNDQQTIQQIQRQSVRTK